MAGGDDLKLLGAWPSPFVTRVKLALALKGLSYEDVEENLYNKSELLLKSNPVHKKIPVLIHNGAPVCESMIIVQYIDDVFASTGPSLLPADPYERAIARFWMAHVDDKLVAPWRQWLRGKTEEEKSEGKKQAFAAVEVLEGALRERCPVTRSSTLPRLRSWPHGWSASSSSTRPRPPCRTWAGCLSSPRHERLQRLSEPAHIQNNFKKMLF
uniref:Glutathione S-transferase n=1 Tax=Triticum urartu TaxID=4572 RepID=A0A8R7UU56_TRIUA